MKIIFL